jgi:hypothetical protein
MKIIKLLPLMFLLITACSESTAPTASATDQTESALQCHKDTDCKGERICDTGKCIAPPATISSQSVPISQTDITDTHCPQSKIVFSCTTTKNKYVEVCDLDSKVSYSFGKPGKKSDIFLSIPLNKAFKSEGRNSYSVSIPNGNTIYTVFNGVESTDDGMKSIQWS